MRLLEILAPVVTGGVALIVQLVSPTQTDYAAQPQAGGDDSLTDGAKRNYTVMLVLIFIAIVAISVSIENVRDWMLR